MVHLICLGFTQQPGAALSLCLSGVTAQLKPGSTVCVCVRMHLCLCVCYTTAASSPSTLLMDSLSSSQADQKAWEGFIGLFFYSLLCTVTTLTDKNPPNELFLCTDWGSFLRTSRGCWFGAAGGSVVGCAMPRLLPLCASAHQSHSCGSQPGTALGAPSPLHGKALGSRHTAIG